MARHATALIVDFRRINPCIGAFLVITLLGLDKTAPYEAIGSFGLGVATGMIVLGVIFTSNYAAKIRAFKLRLLGRK